MDKIVYKIEHDDFNSLLDLKINEYCPIEDNLNNKLIINKLLLNNSKLFLETKYLKVLNIDYENSKLYLEIPNSYIDFFNNLDEICVKLLENLFNTNSDLEIMDLIESTYINNSDHNIQYIHFLEEKSNILKINIFSNTTIKYNKTEQTINDINQTINDIKSGDYVRLVLGLDYISLLVENPLIARTKLYCYFIQINKQHVFNLESREVIKDWNFSDSNNIFLKMNITETDNIDVKTELPNNINFIKLNSCSKNNSERLSPLVLTEIYEDDLILSENHEENKLIEENIENIENINNINKIISNNTNSKKNVKVKNNKKTTKDKKETINNKKEKINNKKENKKESKKVIKNKNIINTNSEKIIEIDNK